MLQETELTRHEITSRGLGWSFVFKYEVFVPFLHTLTTRYLLENPQRWETHQLFAFASVNLVGFIFYRGSNLQKFRFRKNPNDPALARE